MKKLLITIIIALQFLPLLSLAAEKPSRPSGFTLVSARDSASLSWQDPKDTEFAQSILFRSSTPVESYLTFEAFNLFCERVYEGIDQNFTATGLMENLTYHFILFAQTKDGRYSDAVIIKKLPYESGKEEIPAETVTSLIGASSDVVNRVAFTEAGIVYNYNRPLAATSSSESRRLALFIMVKSPHDLSERDKNAISYFIDSGTDTTIVLGAGERTGVLNSYLSVFDKLPRNILEWQDVIKIANGRWPEERKLSAETAAEEHFSSIYQRPADMDNPNDSAAITVIAYGLRPAARNLESETRAIEIYKGIFGRSPALAQDWDLVRAIAYSGASR